MTTLSYRTPSGRPAARLASSPADIARRIRESAVPLDDCPRREVLEVIRRSPEGLTVRLRCGHHVDVAGSVAPRTAKCRPCGREARR